MKVRIGLIVDEPGPRIEPKIFGHFLENIGKGIYCGGLLSPDGRPRVEIVDALARLKVSVLRWPGGLFADGYHWLDGIGARRPRKPNKYWRRFGPWLGPADPNFFGTDEFLALCEKINAAAYINANLGSGTPSEAADWVRYCNAPADDPWGGRRAENGRPQPWGVRIWGIGNESFGFWALGHSDPATYAKRFLEFDQAMIQADPNIDTVAVGTCDLWPNWNPILLSRIGDAAAYLSVHVYLPGNQPLYLCLRVPGTAASHYSLASAHMELARKLQFVAGQIRQVLGDESKVRIALDEWNLWWWWTQLYAVWWKMRDAVAFAGMAGTLVENCEIVAMANIAQAVNVLGLLQTDRARVVVTPLYYVMRMFAEALVGSRIRTDCDSPVFSSKKLGGIPAASGVPYVSAYAAHDGRRCGAVIINRHYEESARIEIDAPGVEFRRVQILSGPSPEARNTFKTPDLVGVEESYPKDGRGGLALNLPAASVAALFGDLKQVAFPIPQQLPSEKQ